MHGHLADGRIARPKRYVGSIRPRGPCPHAPRKPTSYSSRSAAPEELGWFCRSSPLNLDGDVFDVGHRIVNGEFYDRVLAATPAAHGVPVVFGYRDERTRT